MVLGQREGARLGLSFCQIPLRGTPLPHQAEQVGVASHSLPVGLALAQEGGGLMWVGVPLRTSGQAPCPPQPMAREFLDRVQASLCEDLQPHQSNMSNGKDKGRW